jgi:hypothetical protein
MFAGLVLKLIHGFFAFFLGTGKIVEPRLLRVACLYDKTNNTLQLHYVKRNS